MRQPRTNPTADQAGWDQPHRDFQRRVPRDIAGDSRNVGQRDVLEGCPHDRREDHHGRADGELLRHPGEAGRDPEPPHDPAGGQRDLDARGRHGRPQGAAFAPRPHDHGGQDGAARPRGADEAVGARAQRAPEDAGGEGLGGALARRAAAPAGGQGGSSAGGVGVAGSAGASKLIGLGS